MRLAFALLAVLAVLVSPVASVAARAACDHDGPVAMASLQMSAMPGMTDVGADQAALDLCCGHDKGSCGKACAQTCIESCNVTFVLGAQVVEVVLAPMPAEFSPERLAPPHSHQPAGLKRPPKSMV